MSKNKSVHDFSANQINGSQKDLSDYEGKVLLVVNTASKCGFTPQFKGLEALHQELGDRGLEILGFPCNQFAGQDPGDGGEILEFCQANYGVSFAMFEKVKVNGRDSHPLFQYLKSEAKGLLGSEKIKWNFTKFLVNKKGQVIDRFASQTNPASIKPQIEALLQE